MQRQRPQRIGQNEIEERTLLLQLLLTPQNHLLQLPQSPNTLRYHSITIHNHNRKPDNLSPNLSQNNYLHHNKMVPHHPRLQTLNNPLMRLTGQELTTNG
jgi:hypothetical protein